MEMLSGAEMVVQSLVDQGVKQVFGYPGGAVLDIYDALHTLGGIDHVLVRHEQAAVHMADGLARATGEVGVVLVTSGPGAVVVDLPKDILNPAKKLPYSWPDTVSMRSYNPTTSGHKGQIKRALQTLIAAKKPVVYVGGGAINAQCEPQLYALVEKLKLPVASSLMGLGAFPASHQQALGMLGMHGTYEANMTMHNSDVIFAVGVRFDDRTTNNLARYCPNATVLHIDIDPTSISKTVPADVPIVGDARLVLEQMLELLEHEETQQPLDEIRDWWQQIEQWRARHCLQYDTQSGKIKPQAVIETIWRLTNGDAYVTSDVGQHQMFAALYYPDEYPGALHRAAVRAAGAGAEPE